MAKKIEFQWKTLKNAFNSFALRWEDSLPQEKLPLLKALNFGE